ncbi:MAG: hypothetical protein NVSMB32_13370 [Actinomycetota bacterium]
MRTTWALVAAGVALTAGSTIAVIISTKNGANFGGDRNSLAIRVLDSPAGIRNVLSAGSAAEVLILVLGILAVTGEYRHGTITQTFLTTPRRGRAVMAKLVAYLFFGLGLGLLNTAVNLAIGLPWLSSLRLQTAVISGDSGVVLGTVLISSAFYGLLGVGVGALIRNQGLAVVVSLAWLFVVEGILITLLPSVGKWTPGGAAAALHRNLASSAHFLPAWGGGLLLAGYALAFALVGTRLAISRDVT